MKWILTFIFLGSIAWGQNSAKGYTDGNNLRDECGAAIGGQFGYQAGHCFGLMEGYLTVSPIPGFPAHCTPTGVTYEQLAKIVVKYLDQHPEKLHLPAALLISYAAHDAFPCPVKQ